MNKLTLGLAIVAMVGMANAAILVPNGDFETAITDFGTDANWTTDGGEWGVGGYTPSYQATGGSGDNGGYAQLESWGDNWSIFVNPVAAGPVGGGIPIAALGVTAGTTETFTFDMKNFAGTTPGGLKVEAWAGNALLGYLPDWRPASATTEWVTQTVDWAVPAGTEKLIFVPVWGANSTVGFDNIGVVPEPATLGLLGLAGGAMFVFRRFRG